MKSSLLLAAGLCFALFACNNAADKMNESADRIDINDVTDSTGNVYEHAGSSSAAIVNKNDTIHKFVRTADIKFKVNNVEKTTYQVEDIITSHGGFVTLTQLHSHTDQVNTIPISEDSSVERTTYTVTNEMTFRVPNTMLDTTLKDIAKLIGYLDDRVIKADDVSLQLYANRLAQKRSNQHAERLMQVVDKGSKKLDDLNTVEENAEAKQAARDEAILSNASLHDQVNFSTVQLALYQRQTITTATIPNVKELPVYEPSFGNKLRTALASGLQIVETVFIAVMHIWPILLLAIAGVFTYRKYSRKV